MANSHDKFYTFLALNFVLILFVTVIVTLSGFSPFSYSFSLNSTNANTTTKNIDSSTISLNKTALSLIPLMIAEMKNTNVTNIPIEKVINATPSDVTALQNAAKNNVINKLNNITSNALSLANSQNRINNTGNSTNNIQNNSGSNNNTLVNNGLPKINNFASPSPANKTALLPFVVNLTKNTNVTNIAIGKTINATPSDVTALQNAAKNNVINKLNNINNSLAR